MSSYEFSHSDTPLSEAGLGDKRRDCPACRAFCDPHVCDDTSVLCAECGFRLENGAVVSDRAVVSAAVVYHHNRPGGGGGGRGNLDRVLWWQRLSRLSRPDAAHDEILAFCHGNGIPDRVGKEAFDIYCIYRQNEDFVTKRKTERIALFCACIYHATLNFICKTPGAERVQAFTPTELANLMNARATPPYVEVKHIIRLIASVSQSTRQRNHCTTPSMLLARAAHGTGLFTKEEVDVMCHAMRKVEGFLSSKSGCATFVECNPATVTACILHEFFYRKKAPNQNQPRRDLEDKIAEQCLVTGKAYKKLLNDSRPAVSVIFDSFHKAVDFVTRSPSA